MSDDGPRLYPDPQERPLTLCCLGLRITTNDRDEPPLDAVIWDANGARLAGPFGTVQLAVAWIKEHRPRRQ